MRLLQQQGKLSWESLGKLESFSGVQKSTNR